jgi:hypothetical protein
MNKTIYIIFALIFVPGVIISVYYVINISQVLQPSCGTITFDKLPGNPGDAQNVTSASAPYLSLLNEAVAKFNQGQTSYHSAICGDYTPGVIDEFYRGYYIRVTVVAGSG